MTTCVPISELEDAAAFSRKVAVAGEPVIVTKNGYEEFVALDPQLFKTYRKETPEEELERLLSEADRDIASGRLSPAKEGLARIRQAYGL